MGRPETGAAGILGHFFAEAGTRDLAQATSGVFSDSAQLQRVCQQYANCSIDHTQGRAFEFLEVLKFNRAAAAAGSDLRATATHFTDPHNAADIILERGGEFIRAVQAKSNKAATTSIRSLTHEKYAGMDALVPSDKEGLIADLLRRRLEKMPGEGLKRDAYTRLQDALTGRLRVGDLGSGGTTRAEAEFAARFPELVALSHRGSAALTELGHAGALGAGVAGGLGGAFSALSSAWGVRSGDLSATDAVVRTIRGTTAAAVRGGTVSAGARAIVITAREAGWDTLSRSAAPVAIANTIFEAGHATWRYARGDIDATELRDETGGVVLRSVSMFYCGLAGQMLIPVPVAGALVGSLAGYLAAAIMVQAGVLGVGAGNIAAQARDRRLEIEADCLLAIRRMEELHRQIDALARAHDVQFTQQLLPAMTRFEAGLTRGDAAGCVEGLAQVSTGLGAALPWRTLEEFDAFMIDEDSMLVL